jgi:hypothetical protein
MPDVGSLSLEAAVSASDATDDVSSVSSASSVTAETWAGVLETARYFALWGGGIVFTDRYVHFQLS